MGDVGNKIVW